MTHSLKNQAAKGMAWTAFEKAMLQFVHFAVGIVLARFLMPADYGIVPMLALLYAICSTFIDSGMGSALVRKKDRTDLDYSTLFYFNLGVSVFCYICLFFAAPCIARFFNMPILCMVTRITAISFVVGALGTVQRTRLNIALNFKPMTLVDLAMSVLSGIAGVYMAYKGFGVWALVWPGLITSMIGTAIIWRVTGWRPMLAFSRESFKEMFGFGSKILCSSLINTIYSNLSSLIIGKFYTPADLGLYGRGYQFPSFPSGFVQGAILRVAYPLLANVNNEAPERLADIYQRVLRLPVFLLIPVLVGLASIAHPLVLVLLGDKWLGCVPILQIACFGCLWAPLTHINLNLLYVKGRSDLVLRLEVFKKTIAFAMLIASFKFGVLGIVSSMALYEFVAYSFNCYYTGKFIGLGELRQLRMFLPIFINGMVMGIAVWISEQFFDSPILKLVVGIPTGAVVFLLLSIIQHDSTLRDLQLSSGGFVKWPWRSRCLNKIKHRVG